MANFVDASGVTWIVDIDGLSLAELKEKGVDIVTDGLFLIEVREDALTNALLVICREQITQLKLSNRDFARRLAGDTSAKAIEAVRGAAQVFFRPSRWSEIHSLCETKKQLQAMLPMLDLINSPAMPDAIRDVIKNMLADKIEAASSSQNSEPKSSAFGQVATPANVASTSPDSSASTPKE